jgi:diaminopimelate epimerase
VETVNNRLTLSLQPDGRVTVDMNQPRFAPADLPFDPTGLTRARSTACRCGRWTWAVRRPVSG